MPKVSVISASYNHAKYLPEAIESVLNQTFTDFEYIISDDASTDNSIEIIERYAKRDSRITLIANKINRGNSINLDRAKDKCTGEYIALLTTDDAYTQDSLEYRVRYLEENPHVLGVFTAAELIDERGKLIGHWTDEGVGCTSEQLLHNIFFQKHVLCAPTLMLRRSILDRIGHYPANLRQINDVALWIELLFAGPVAVLPHSIFKYRIRDGEQNTSAPTKVALDRFGFEITEVLELFAKNLTAMADLLRVFPEAQNFSWPKVDALTHFFLAHLAFEFNHPAYKLFGTRLLHRLFADADRAMEIQQLTGFGYNDFFRITGTGDILADPGLKVQLDECNRKLQHLESIEAQLQELKRHCQHLELQHSEMVASTSWRITKPIRSFRQILGKS